MASRDPAELFGYDVKGNDRPAPRLSPHQFGHISTPGPTSLANVPGQVQEMRDRALEGQKRLAKAGRDFADLRSGRKTPMQVISDAAGIASPEMGEMRRQTDSLASINRTVGTMAGRQQDMADQFGQVLNGMDRMNTPAPGGPQQGTGQPSSQREQGPLARQLGNLSEDEAQAVLNSIPRAQSRPKVAGTVVNGSNGTPYSPSSPTPFAQSASGSMAASVGLGRPGAGRPVGNLQPRQFRPITIAGPAVDVAVEGHPNALASGTGWPHLDEDESFTDYPPAGSRQSGLGWPSPPGPNTFPQL